MAEEDNTEGLRRMLMWTVTSDYVKGRLTYFVEHKETGERRMMSDCEQWASRYASELNEREQDEDTVRRVRNNSHKSA